MALIQAWTGPKCQSGAVPLGPIAQITRGTVTEAIDGRSGPSLTVPASVVSGIGLVAGAWLWVSHPRRGITEWPVLTLTSGDGLARDTVQIECGTIRQALALRGTVRRINQYGPITTSFTLSALTPANILTSYFFTNLAADNLSWLSLGTSDFGGTYSLGTINQWTRAQLLEAIETATGGRFVFTRQGDTGYRLDLIDYSSRTTVDAVLAPPVTLTTLERTEDLVSGATVVEPRTSSGAPMQDCWWKVDAITGTGPYWVRLTDPAGGPPVIREDDQCIGWFLRPNDGTAIEITDSRASDSSVQVGSRTGLIIGDLASLWRTADGQMSAEVSSPTGLALRNRVVQSVTVPVASATANRVADPALRNRLAGWELVNRTSGGADVYQRDDPTTVALTTTASAASGATSVAVTGPAGAAVRFGDVLLVTGTAVATNAVRLPDATGRATVPLASTLPTTLSDNTVLAWRRSGVDLGTATVDGTQASGSSSLALKGLPSTPQLTAADTLVRSQAQTFSFVPGSLNYTGVTLPSGTSVIVSDARRNLLDPTARTVYVGWEGTLSATANVGDVISVDTTNRPALPTGWFILSATATVTVSTTIGTWTLTGAQPAWNATTLQATATITGTWGGGGLSDGEPLEWLRAGARIGSVQVVGNALGTASTATLQLVTAATKVNSGDTFELSAQTLYSNSELQLSDTGTGTITFRVATTAAIPNATAITIQRCPDYSPTAFGGPVVLRLRGDTAVFPTTYKGTGFAIYSPIIRVQGANPTANWGGIIECGLTRWAAESGQTQRGWMCLWDVDTQAQITVVGLGTSTPSYTPLYNVVTHSIISQSVGQSTPTSRVRLSLHPGAGQVGDAPGGFTFLRWVALTVGTGLSSAAQVDGSFSNQLWHRGQDILQARRDLARYRVTLPTLAPLGDDAPLISAGSVVRVRSDALAVDSSFRVQRLVWSLQHDDDLELELATLTPRLSETFS